MAAIVGIAVVSLAPDTAIIVLRMPMLRLEFQVDLHELAE
jgi:hypothetical protein